MTQDNYTPDAIPVPEQGTASYKGIHQLYKDIPESHQHIFPVTYTQSVYDGKTGANLEHILHQFNCIFLQYQGTGQATRNLLPKDMRRKGIIISYRDMDNNVITERNIDESESTSDNWGLDKYWEYFEGFNLDDIKEYLESEEFKEYIETVIEESIGEGQGWQPPTSGDGSKFLDDSGVFDTIKIRDVQGLTDTGTGNNWLTDNGVYTNPFPSVSEEQVLTIMPNQIVSSKPVQVMSIVTDESTEYTAATLNEEFSSRPVGFVVNQYTLGKVFQKVSDTGVWISYNVNTVV